MPISPTPRADRAAQLLGEDERRAPGPQRECGGGARDRGTRGEEVREPLLLAHQRGRAGHLRRGDRSRVLERAVGDSVLPAHRVASGVGAHAVALEVQRELRAADELVAGRARRGERPAFEILRSWRPGSPAVGVLAAAARGREGNTQGRRRRASGGASSGLYQIFCSWLISAVVHAIWVDATGPVYLSVPLAMPYCPFIVLHPALALMWSPWKCSVSFESLTSW